MKRKDLLISLAIIADTFDEEGKYTEANVLTKTMIRLAQSDQARTTYPAIKATVNGNLTVYYIDTPTAKVITLANPTDQSLVAKTGQSLSQIKDVTGQPFLSTINGIYAYLDRGQSNTGRKNPEHPGVDMSGERNLASQQVFDEKEYSDATDWIYLAANKKATMGELYQMMVSKHSQKLANKVIAWLKSQNLDQDVPINQEHGAQFRADPQFKNFKGYYHA